MSNVVEVNQLTKKYGNVTAVDGVTFSVEENKIYGLLGRNGAGKTTIMHMITSQLVKSLKLCKSVYNEFRHTQNNVKWNTLISNLH